MGVIAWLGLRYKVDQSSAWRRAISRPEMYIVPARPRTTAKTDGLSRNAVD